MALKYKLDDVVVLGENVDAYESFRPGALVRIGKLWDAGTADEHYTVQRVDGKGSKWWVYEDEINHEATEKLHMLNKARDTVQFTGLAELLQKSNETSYIVGKERVVSDDNAKEVRTPASEENAPQTAVQTAIENTYSAAYNSVSVFPKSNTNECLKITIDGEALVFQQECDGDIQEILLDFNAVGAVFSAANDLIVQYEEKVNECSK